MDSGGAEIICTLEEEVWLVSGCGHLRPSALSCSWPGVTGQNCFVTFVCCRWLCVSYCTLKRSSHGQLHQN